MGLGKSSPVAGTVGRNVAPLSRLGDIRGNLARDSRRSRRRAGT
jgi:hypothetical protein